MSEKLLAYENAIVVIEKSVNRLWQAVADGLYDSRSIVGDEVLNMRDVLNDLCKITNQSKCKHKWRRVKPPATRQCSLCHTFCYE